MQGSAPDLVLLKILIFVVVALVIMNILVPEDVHGILPHHKRAQGTLPHHGRKPLPRLTIIDDNEITEIGPQSPLHADSVSEELTGPPNTPTGI